MAPLLVSPACSPTQAVQTPGAVPLSGSGVGASGVGKRGPHLGMPQKKRIPAKYDSPFTSSVCNCVSAAPAGCGRSAGSHGTCRELIHQTANEHATPLAFLLRQPTNLPRRQGPSARGHTSGRRSWARCRQCRSGCRGRAGCMTLVGIACQVYFLGWASLSCSHTTDALQPL